MNDPHSQSTRAYTVLAFGILAVSTASIFIRFAQAEASSLVVAAFRLTLSALLLVPFVLWKAKAEIRQLSQRDWFQLILAGLFLGLHFASWITSLEFTSVASSVVIVTTTPLWVALLSPLVLKERLKPGIWPGLLLAMVGGILVGLQQTCTLAAGGLTCQGLDEMLQGRALLGNILALFGAWLSASYLLVGRRVRPRLSLISYSFIVYGSAALLLILMVVFTRQPVSGFSPAIYGYLVLLAVIPQLMGHSAFNWALRYVPATLVSLALLGEPIGTTILAMLFLKEAPAGGEILGGALILTGIYLASRQEDKPDKQPVDTTASA